MEVEKRTEYNRLIRVTNYMNFNCFFDHTTPRNTNINVEDKVC
jgi:hypothetical protein